MKRATPLFLLVFILASPVYGDQISISGAHAEGDILARSVTTTGGPDGSRGITLLNNTFYNPAPGSNGLHFVANKARIVENGKAVFAVNNVNYTVYAIGTAATIDNMAAVLDFTGNGSVDPSLTLTSPGTYLIFSNAQLYYNAATFFTPQTCQIYLYRTNNKPGILAHATTTVPLNTLTATTGNGGAAVIPSILYTTTNADDTIAVYGVLSAPTSAGSFQATEASIVAVRLY